MNLQKDLHELRNKIVMLELEIEELEALQLTDISKYGEIELKIQQKRKELRQLKKQK